MTTAIREAFNRLCSEEPLHLQAELQASAGAICSYIDSLPEDTEPDWDFVGYLHSYVINEIMEGSN